MSDFCTIQCFMGFFTSFTSTTSRQQDRVGHSGRFAEMSFTEIHGTWSVVMGCTACSAETNKVPKRLASCSWRVRSMLLTRKSHCTQENTESRQHVCMVSIVFKLQISMRVCEMVPGSMSFYGDFCMVPRVWSLQTFFSVVDSKISRFIFFAENKKNSQCLLILCSLDRSTDRWSDKQAVALVAATALFTPIAFLLGHKLKEMTIACLPLHFCV